MPVRPRQAEDGYAPPARRRARLAIAAVRATLLVAAVLTALPLLPTHGAETLIWRQVAAGAPLPPPRSQFGMAADAAGNVYVYGGRASDGTALADFWLFRAATGSWQQLQNTAVPPLIEPHLAVDAAGNVLEFGGIGDPHGHNFSYDGHSFGLYVYSAAQGGWIDRTSNDAEPGVNWPPGREDHGFAFDAANGLFYAFGGEGTADVSLGDMWSFNEATGTWSPIEQRFQAPNEATIDAREIYNISYDNHNGFYLFGGSYLQPEPPVASIPPYVNDLWHFDMPSATWTLIAGTANGYDPALPVPRHYYAQACDPDGNFYILGGYTSDDATPPFFAAGTGAGRARSIALAGARPDPKLFPFALADFWLFNAGAGRWTDLSEELGDLGDGPLIPYAMVDDTANNALVTFGGFHPAGPGMLAPSSGTWIYGLPSETGTMPPIPTIAPMPTATATAPPAAAMATEGSTPTASPTPDEPATLTIGAIGMPTARAGQGRTAGLGGTPVPGPAGDDPATPLLPGLDDNPPPR